MIHKDRASPVKIAYYIQNIAKKDPDPKKIILIIASRFDKRDIKTFAKRYKYCINEDNVKRIARIIFSTPKILG